MKLAAIALTLLAASTPTTQAKPETYVVCEFNFASSESALVQRVVTSGPVTITAPAKGSESVNYYAIFEMTAPVSCATLLMDSEQEGPYPPGISIEGDTSHKPTLS